MLHPISVKYLSEIVILCGCSCEVSSMDWLVIFPGINEYVYPLATTQKCSIL